MGKEFYGAVATLVGTIVGVGAFGLPYVVAKSGFLIGLIFLFIISGVVLLLHLFYGEIVLRTPGKHRFVGYAEIYLGRWGKRLTTFTATIIIYGALLAYIIVGGKFLSTIFGRSEFFWSLIFFVVCAGAIFLGLKVVTKIEIFMSFFLIGIVFLIFVKGWPSINFDNLTNLNWAYFFLPYGVVLWAVGGWAAIPEMKEIFKQKYQFLKKAIIWGTLLPPLLYIIFIFTVVGVTGSATSSEGIIGLAAALKNNVIILGAFFGLLAVTTSFLVLGLCLKKIFWYDYKMNKHLAWVLTCFVPLIAYLCHLRDFVAVIGFLGATLSGLEGILMVKIYWRAKKMGRRQPEYSLRVPRLVSYGLIVLLSLGIVYQIIYSI